jgi:DNA-3-methyladenine glycosylase II
MASFSFRRPRGFALRAARDFYADFVPGSGMAAAGVDDELRLVFRLDGSFEAVGVALRERGQELTVEYVGTRDEEAVRAQVARMLGLEANAEAWLELGASVPLVGRLQAAFPGFFTAAKASPYDAAAWGVISPRLRVQQAARLKLGLAEQFGSEVSIAGVRYPVFPAPAQVLTLRDAPGLSAEKLRRLQAIASAALSGELNAERLRALPEHVALAALQRLPGVGPWTASHILYRGAAPIDGLPSAEPRVLHAFAAASDGGALSLSEYQQLAESCRPFRMWVCVLAMRLLARLGQWQKPEYALERARAGRALRAHP